MKPADLLKRLEAKEPENANGLEAYLDAAAVLDTFDLEGLRPSLGKFGSGRLPRFVKDAAELRKRSLQLASGRWRLRDGIRTVQLRKLNHQDLIRARGANDGDTTVRQRYLDRWLLGEAVEWQNIDHADELRAAIQVLRWLEAAAIPERPQVAELEARLRRLERLVPLRHIAKDFQDRTDKLETLHRHVAEQTEPLVVYGVGGAGKSALVARFVLDLEQQNTAWVYVDMDEAAVDAARPVTLIEALVRQTADHHAEIEHAARYATRELQKDSRTPEADIDWQLVSEALGSILSDKRLVLVIDTFEEAQIAGPVVLDRLLRVLASLRQAHPSVRVVISGRVPIDGLPSVEVADLPKEFAEKLLSKLLLPHALSAPIMSELLALTGGLPLSILLAADAIKRELAEGGEPSQLLNDLGRLDRAIIKEKIQGFLYMRVLNHLRPDPGLRVLAHATLALPAFNEALLVSVVAPACRVEPERARELFVALRKEVAFIRSAGTDDAWARHRADLRELVQPFLSVSLNDAHIDLGRIREQAREWILKRREELDVDIVMLFTNEQAEAVSGLGRLDEAQLLLDGGEPQAAVDSVLAAGAEHTAEGGSLSARAYLLIGDPDKARASAEQAIDAAADAGDLAGAVRLAIWAWDHLNGTEAAERLSHRSLKPIDRLALLAAQAASQQRHGVSAPALLEQVTTARKESRRDQRVDKPELLVRLAGLLASEPDALIEAAEWAGFSAPTAQELASVAQAIAVWDELLAPGATTGPLHRLLEVQRFADQPEPWTRALEAQASSDLAPLLKRLLYTHETPPAVTTALAAVFAQRDAKRFETKNPRRSSAPSAAELHVPERLAAAQVAALARVLVDTFKPAELERMLAGSKLGALRHSVNWSAPWQVVCFQVLEQANKQGLITQLVEVILSLGTTRNVRKILARALDEAGAPNEPDRTVAPPMATLADALVDTFSENELEHVVWRVGRKAAARIPSNLAHEYKVPQLLDLASREGWLLELLTELERARPSAEDLVQAIERARHDVSLRPEAAAAAAVRAPHVIVSELEGALFFGDGEKYVPNERFTAGATFRARAPAASQLIGLRLTCFSTRGIEASTSNLKLGLQQGKPPEQLLLNPTRFGYRLIEPRAFGEGGLALSVWAKFMTRLPIEAPVEYDYGYLALELDVYENGANVSERFTYRYEGARVLTPASLPSVPTWGDDALAGLEAQGWLAPGERQRLETIDEQERWLLRQHVSFYRDRTDWSSKRPVSELMETITNRREKLQPPPFPGSAQAGSMRVQLTEPQMSVSLPQQPRPGSVRCALITPELLGEESLSDVDFELNERMVSFEAHHLAEAWLTWLY